MFLNILKKRTEYLTFLLSLKTEIGNGMYHFVYFSLYKQFNCP